MVSAREGTRYLTAWSGLITGPAAWATSTQLNYALVPWQCGNHAYPIPWVALVLAIISLAGAFLSWREWRNAANGGIALAAGTAALAAILFAAVILLQTMASLIFTGCER